MQLFMGDRNMTKNKNATRYYSMKQEEYISGILNGKVQPGSGSPHFYCGDVVTDDWLIECKTSMKPKESFAIKKDWIIKNERERMDLQKPYSSLVFQFEPDGENYFIVNEKTFKILLDNMNDS